MPASAGGDCNAHVHPGRRLESGTAAVFFPGVALQLREASPMPNRLFEVFADHQDLVVLCGTAVLAFLGAYLLLQRILVSARRRRAGIDADPSSDDDEDRWDWEHPFDPVPEPLSSQASAPKRTADLDLQPEHARPAQRVRIEHFEPLSESGDSSSIVQVDTFTSPPSTSQAS